MCDTDMQSENNLEIYRQRYETFRHLDRMRFQLLQILVAFGAAIALFYRFHPTPADWLVWWVSLLVGAMLFLVGWTMMKVSSGLWANNVILHTVAHKIGDRGIPKPAKWKSAWHWISVAVLILGVLLSLNGLVEIVDLTDSVGG